VAGPNWAITSRNTCWSNSSQAGYFTWTAIVSEKAGFYSPKPTRYGMAPLDRFAPRRGFSTTRTLPREFARSYVRSKKSIRKLVDALGLGPWRHSHGNF